MPYCGRCGAQYAKKEKWLNHFQLEHLLQPTIGRGYVENPCYKQPSYHPKIFHSDKDEAKRLYNSAVKGFSSFKFSSAKRPCVDDDDNDDDEKVPVAGASNDSNADVEMDSSTNDTIQDVSESSCKILEEFSKITKKLEQQHLELCSKVDDNFSNVNTKLTNLKLSASNTDKSKLEDENFKVDTDDLYTVSIILLRDAKSVSDIMDNHLIKDAFITCAANDIMPSEEVQVDSNNVKLICKPCADNIVTSHKRYIRNHSFQIIDMEYECTPKSGRMKGWFSNLKKNLRAHLGHLTHHQNVAAYKMLSTHSLAKREDTRRICAEIMYYVLVTNTAFRLYPVLLAVISKCGLEIGNINHTRFSITTVS